MTLILILTFGSETLAKELIIGVSNQGKSIELETKVKTKFYWKKKKSGARKLYWKSLIEAPVSLEPVRSKKGRTLFRKKKLFLSRDRLKTIVKLKSKLILEAQWKGEFNQISQTQCLENGLELRSLESEFPFYVGVYCERVDDKLRVHLGFPKEVELSESTLFDSMGKGENFRVYDLEKLSTTDALVGTIELSLGEKTYPFNLISLTAESREKDLPRANFLIGVGSGQLTLETVGVEAEYSNYLLILKLLPRDLISWLGAGINAETTLQSTSEDDLDSLSYLQISAFAYSNFSLAKWWKIAPRIYYSFSEQVSGTGIDYKASQAGAGVYTEFHVTERFQFHLEYMTLALSSPIIDSHMYVSLTLFYRDRSSLSGWGLQSQLQEFSVSDESGNERQFGQILFSLQRSF